MEEITKEVHFDEFCPKCEYWTESEWEEPCNECLENPVNYYSHHPMKWKEKTDTKSQKLQTV